MSEEEQTQVHPIFDNTGLLRRISLDPRRADRYHGLPRYVLRLLLDRYRQYFPFIPVPGDVIESTVALHQRELCVLDASTATLITEALNHLRDGVATIVGLPLDEVDSHLAQTLVEAIATFGAGFPSVLSLPKFKRDNSPFKRPLPIRALLRELRRLSWCGIETLEWLRRVSSDRGVLSISVPERMPIPVSQMHALFENRIALVPRNHVLISGGGGTNLSIPYHAGEIDDDPDRTGVEPMFISRGHPGSLDGWQNADDETPEPSTAATETTADTQPTVAPTPRVPLIDRLSTPPGQNGVA